MQSEDPSLVFLVAHLFLVFIVGLILNKEIDEVH